MAQLVEHISIESILPGRKQDRIPYLYLYQHPYQHPYPYLYHCLYSYIHMELAQSVKASVPKKCVAKMDTNNQQAIELREGKHHVGGSSLRRDRSKSSNH